MADVREMLGRLNAQTIKMDIGRGGLPELTNQDIAAALGMVDAGLGRELLEACWWADGGVYRRTNLRDAVLELVRPELRRQAALLTDARTSYGIACACLGWNGPVTQAQLAEKARAAARLEQVQDQCWPRATLESLPVLVRAVISEMTHQSLCERCAGRRKVVGSTDSSVPCKACNGQGCRPMSNMERARRIGRDEAAYRRSWRGVYEWLISRFREAESNAVAQFARVLAKE